MDSLEKRIFGYGELSADEKRALEAEVSDTPTYRTLLREVKQLEAEFRHVRLPSSTDPSHDIPDTLLALYAVHEVHQLDTPAVLKGFFVDVKTRLQNDEGLAERMTPIMERAQNAKSSFDVAEHFESVTGHAIDDLPAKSTDHTRSEPEKGLTQARNDRPPKESDRPRRVSEQALNYAWYVGGTVIAMLALYGVLLVLSMTLQSPAERMAAINPSETQIQGYEVNTRSATAEPSSNDERFLLALRTLDDAYTSTLGLFPRFNEAEVQQAQDLLETVIDEESASSFLQLEAQFFLGKTYLAQGQIEEARSALQRVVIGEGRRASDASRMLEDIEAHYPMEVPTLPEGSRL